MSNYILDASHSSVDFSVRHMMITNVRGEFQSVKGTATYDAADPSKSVLEATIDVASINTRNEQRDGHLKSPDFFDVEKFPTITFRSTSAKRSGDDEVEIVGDLTIHGVTKSVTLTVSDVTGESKDPFGNVRFGAHATTKIKRSDFGMTWNSAIEAGGMLVGDEIKISIDASLIKQA